jgi:hypothetical protein
MNIFRFLGDLSHIVSFLVLLHKIIKGKSSAGISLRTQELYAGACCEGARASADLCLRRQDARHALAPPCQAALEPVASVMRVKRGGGGGGAIHLRGAALAVRSRLLQPVH